MPNDMDRLISGKQKPGHNRPPKMIPERVLGAYNHPDGGLYIRLLDVPRTERIGFDEDHMLVDYDEVGRIVGVWFPKFELKG